MTKIIDTFLFFQELDLLEIRLAYLAPYIDRFIIVEACQTFSGKQKEFIFEKNLERYKKYLHKIEYFKISDFHKNYDSVKEYLQQADTFSHNKVLKFLESHNHYPKTELHWVLDSYHRECIHIALDRIAEPQDIVILSDLDEIPDVEIFSESNLSLIKLQPRACRQKEFRYFLNFYKDHNWVGSIAGIQNTISQFSLNLLRADSKSKRTIVNRKLIEKGGYHFTSCGGIKMIKDKIESWGHQEYNNKFIIDNVEKFVRSGQDIFQRETGTNLIQVDICDTNYFDQEMSTNISLHHHLISNFQLKPVRISLIRDMVRRIIIFWNKVLYKLGRRHSS